MQLLVCIGAFMSGIMIEPRHFVTMRSINELKQQEASLQEPIVCC